MSKKYKYPSELIEQIGLNKNITYTPTIIYNTIFSKCTMMYGKLKMPKNIYLNLITDQWLINNANNDTKDYMLINKSTVKQSIKSLSKKEQDDTIYVSITSIYSDIPIRQLEVVI